MKKYVLFIVEGQNDKKEIQAILRAACGQSFLESYVDAYHVHDGDITTETDTNEKSIVSKLNKIVISWRMGGEQPFQRIPVSDVARIIQIIDTDGVFIPESAIKNTDDSKARYTSNSICYYDRNIIIGRNRKKERVISKLLETRLIDNIPYGLYFASCNMDHLLFDERNMIDKRRNAMLFASRCKDRSDLSDSVLSQTICATGTLIESWEDIREGFNSLNRHTNINLLLEDYS